MAAKKKAATTKRGTSFTKVDDAGRSIAEYKRRREAKRKVPSGQGDRGDRA
jgi:hypothetical protein